MQEIQTSIEMGIDLFKDIIFTSWKAVKGYTKEKYQENDPFGIATRKYIGGLIDKYNWVKVLGMSEPIALKKLYVRANILEKISARMGLRPEELAKFFDFDRRNFGKSSETVDGEIIVNRLQKFIVLGKPGAGKTTYLKFLMLMMLDKYSQIQRRRLPIFVTLREWADKKIPLMDFIVEQFNICGFAEAQLFGEKILSDGKCLVLFDGLDEVSQEANVDGIIRQICDFTDKYSDNQFVISCRVAAYNHSFERFTDVEMADFNGEQMETFVRNWFHGEPKTATECWERLKGNPQLRELASVPLLLTLLCLEYAESNGFPLNRAELYERAIETLLTKWDSSRRIRRDEVYKQLSIKRKESMFARIAFATFAQNHYFIRERTLAKMVERYIENIPGFNAAELEPDSRAVLQAIASQHGIFVERARDVFSFAHLTFQEYFTAKYIVDNQWKKVDKDGNVDESGMMILLEHIVDKYINDSRWKEVFLLVAGMVDNAEELLWLMRGKANEVHGKSVINEMFLLMQTSLLKNESKLPKAIRANYAVFLMLAFARGHTRVRARTRALGLVRALIRAHDLEHSHDLSLDRAFALDLALDRAIELDRTFDLALARSARTLALDLDIDLSDVYRCGTNFQIQNMEYIDNYFSSNILIMECLSSGAYVSKSIREKLINEIFMTREQLNAGGWQADQK